MNNEIEPIYVSFEQAKWLKEIGFNEKCSHYYIDNFQNFKHDGTLYKCGLPDKNENKNLFQFVTRKNQPHLCNTPEQWQVVEWLRVNHGIWVYTYPVAPFVADDEDYPKIVWVSKICSLSQVNFEKFIDADNGLAVNHHRSPQEAYSAAFDYIRLNNLIK